MATTRIEFSEVHQGVQVLGAAHDEMWADVICQAVPAGGAPREGFTARVKLIAGERFARENIEVSFPGLDLPLNRHELTRAVQDYYISALERTMGITQEQPAGPILMQNNAFVVAGWANISYAEGHSAGW